MASQESGSFTLFYGGAERPEFGTGFLVRRRICSAIRKVHFVSDRISYIILKGKLHDFVIVNVHGPTEDKDDKMKDEFYEELECVFDSLSRYNMKMVLGDFNAKVEQEVIFRPTIGKFSLHEDSNNNGVILVTFATSTGAPRKVVWGGLCGAPEIFSYLLKSVQMLKTEWCAESNRKLPHLFIPSKTATLIPEFAVEDLPLSRTAAMVPEFVLKDLPLGRTLMIILYRSSFKGHWD